MKVKRKRSEHGFRTYEVLEKGKYLYNIFPADGDPFESFAREQERNTNLRLVEVRNGERKEVVSAFVPTVRDIEDSDFEYDEEDFQ